MLKARYDQNKKKDLALVIEKTETFLETKILTVENPTKADMVDALKQHYGGDEFDPLTLQNLEDLFDITDLQYFDATPDEHTFIYSGSGLGVPGVPSPVTMKEARRMGDYTLHQLRAALENGNFEDGPITEPEDGEEITNG